MKKRLSKAGKISVAGAAALALMFGGVSVATLTGCDSSGTEVSAKEVPGDPPSGDPPAAPPDGAGGSGSAGDGAPGGTPPDGAPGGEGGSGGAPGGSATSVSWSGATEIKDSGTFSNKTYTSSTANQNALLVSGNVSPTFDTITVDKTGGEEAGDSQSFYGTNSGIMVKDGAKVIIKKATIKTSAAGANGVFSYGGSATTGNTSSDGTSVTISDSEITTSGDGSGGIMTTGGGTTTAKNLTVNTSGRSSAAIRTDRGGGTVIVDGGTYTTSGMGSPTIYSTADITVSNATLTSNTSEGVCIEGSNSIMLDNCVLTANNNKKNGQAQYLDTIMIYQSFSGDAAGTGSKFTMKGGTLNSKSGHVFHVTNTSATIELNGVNINNTDSGGVLLSVVNDGWKGAENKAVVNATAQKLSGKIIVSNTASSASSSKSTLSLKLDSASSFVGSIGDENGTGDALGTVDVTLDGTWKLTADSYVTSITGSGTIDYNGHTLYVNGTAYTAGSPGGSITAGAVTETATSPDATSTDPTSTNVATTEIKSVKRNKNKKSATVTVSDVDGAEGYEIAYSTDKSFAGGKTQTVTTKSTKTKIRSLKKKKTYYARARAYKTVDGKKIYGEWSAVKKV